MQGVKNEVYSGGWLDRILRGLLEEKNTELLVCYPYDINEEGNHGNLSYRAFSSEGRNARLGKMNDIKGIEQVQRIIQEFSPDVIHIHGTEFQYHWFFAQAAKNLSQSNRLVVSMQGIVGIYAKHFALGLPAAVCYTNTAREFIGRKNVQAGINNFLRRGKYEEKTIQITNHIIGRTTWDKACTYRINPRATYHLCNETLREEFYTGEWKQETMIKHRIFISQAFYPIKGFHLFLEALEDIKKFFPDVTVHVAGSDVTRGGMMNGSSYGIYIKRQIKKKGLTSCVQFCGNLNAQQMKEEMLAANVFVSPSTIENSSNSIGEAMLLGVPVVSSNVGGVPDLLQHGKEGFLYQSDAPYMLAYYVMQMFNDEQLAFQMGQSAKRRASGTHNYKKNLDSLVNIYLGIVAEVN